MRTMRITRKHRKAVLPGGSPFRIIAPTSILCFNRRVTVMTTGIGLIVPDNLDLSFETAMQDLAFMGHVFVRGELALLLSAIGNDDITINAGDKVAMCTVIKRQTEAVRFVEFTPSGGRLVKGDARPVEHRD